MTQLWSPLPKVYTIQKNFLGHNHRPICQKQFYIFGPSKKSREHLTDNFAFINLLFKALLSEISMCCEGQHAVETKDSDPFPIVISLIIVFVIRVIIAASTYFFCRSISWLVPKKANGSIAIWYFMLMGQHHFKDWLLSKCCVTKKLRFWLNNKSSSY